MNVPQGYTDAARWHIASIWKARTTLHVSLDFMEMAENAEINVSVEKS